MGASEPSISIITVARNSSGTIRDCIASVQHQDYSAEHILIDGASHDDTLETVKRQDLPNVRIVSEPDLGIYDAMNKGLTLAEGEIVGVLNADDFYPHSDVLSMISEAFAKHGVDSCYGDLIYVERQNIAKVIRVWKSCEYKESLFYNGWMPAHPTFFVRRSIFKRFGAYDINAGTAADYELMLRFLLRHRITTHYLPELLVIMRSGGVSNGSWSNRLRAHRNDRFAWQINGLSPKPWTLIAKPLSKIGQLCIFQSKVPLKVKRWWLTSDVLAGKTAVPDRAAINSPIRGL